MLVMPWRVNSSLMQGLELCQTGEMRTHLALFARVSWNSYDQRWPDSPIVLAMECVNEPEPVPVQVSEDETEAEWEKRRTCFDDASASLDVET